jgi:hypothetical protein
VAEAILPDRDCLRMESGLPLNHPLAVHFVKLAADQSLPQGSGIPMKSSLAATALSLRRSMVWLKASSTAAPASCTGPFPGATETGDWGRTCPLKAGGPIQQNFSVLSHWKARVFNREQAHPLPVKDAFALAL